MMLIYSYLISAPHKACQDLSNWMTLKYTPTENCSDNFFSVQFIPEYSTKFHAKILKVNETSQENDIYFTEEPVFTTISPWPMFCVPNKYMKNDTYYIGSWFIRKHNSQCQPIQKYYSIDSLRKFTMTFKYVINGFTLFKQLYNREVLSCAICGLILF